MNMISRWLCWIIILTVSTFAAGCATGGPKTINILESGIAEKKTIVRGDEYITIKSVGIFQEDNNLIISGKVERLKSRPKSYDSHIDYAVLAADGTVLKYGSTRFQRFSSKRWITPFSASLPIRAEKGTLVRLAYHPVSGPPMKEFKCPRNAAVPGSTT